VTDALGDGGIGAAVVVSALSVFNGTVLFPQAEMSIDNDSSIIKNRENFIIMSSKEILIGF
jgi:hypothetical protein